MEGESSIMCTLSNYLQLIKRRASGCLMTNAAWMRDFVLKHKAYKKDSVVSDEICYDLLAKVEEIQSGKSRPEELLGDLKIRSFQFK